MKDLVHVIVILVTLKSVIGDGVYSFQNADEHQNKLEAQTMCPNNHTRCNNRQTCCITKHGSYHCCRYPNAVCCPDKYHCCPEDSTCNTETHRCEKNDNRMLSLVPPETLTTNLQELVHLSAEVENVCPNKKTKCQDTKTCCITKHNNYYCCPHKNAVCCPDKYHCCPESTSCDSKTNTCVNSSYVSQMHQYDIKPDQLYLLKPAQKIPNDFYSIFNKLEKKCPNSQTTCPGKKKCCSMANGKYGCCKFDKGVCCPDMTTCCPHETSCDVKNKACITPATNLIPTLEKKSLESKIVCPDKIECSSSQTCCYVGYDSYGCCPFANGTCCPDKIHCCPHDKNCDSKSKMCIPKPKVGYLKKESLVKYFEIFGLKDICPDKSKCRGDETCCKVNQSGYGCCPYSHGTCCADMKSCCPKGYTCTAENCEPSSD